MTHVTNALANPFRRRRVLAAGFVLLGAVRAAPGAEPQARAREWLMGTIAEVRVYDAGAGGDAIGASEAVLAEFRIIDRLMAVQRPESDVSRVNREGGRGPVQVDRRVIEVLEASARFGRATGGAFDVTVLPAVRAWGFDGDRPHAPAPGAPRTIAGFAHVVTDAGRGTVRFTHPAAQVDLGGIAKGYALDRARAILRARGVRSAWLDLGGEVATLGVPPEGGRWRVGIRHPRRPGALLGVVEVGEAAVSTSGDAERWIEVEGQRRGHVIDPRTGMSATRLASATVVAPSAAVADALSTAAVVLGVAASRPVLEAYDAAGVFAVAGPDGEIGLTATPGAPFEPAGES